MRKIVSVFGALMLCSVLAFAQMKVVTGKVTDERGASVPYATVTESGTTNATTADANGNYSLRIQNNGRLLFTSTGFNELSVSPSGSNADAKLIRGSAQLSEVVVTALGIKRNRNQVAYAVQQVSGDEVSKTRNNNFIQNLSGKVAGLDIKQPNGMGASTNVILRGAKSLSNSNQALFVIDGVPIDNANNNTTDQVTGRGGYDYGNAAADINPDNIESISVLKGPAASALYGSRGFNGVIMITTKKGKKGLGVTLNTGIVRNSIIRSTFPTYQKQYGAGYGAYFNEVDVNGDGVDDLVAPTQDDASWGTKFDPNLQVYQWDAFDPSSPNFGKARPWVAAQNDPSSFFEKPLSFNNSVLLETGGDKGNFTLGYTRNDERGVLPNASINKDLLNLSASYNVTDQFTAGGTINFTRIRGKGRYGTGYDGANAGNLMTNFREWWQVNVDIKDLQAAYFRTLKNVTWNPHDGPGGALQPEFWDNPYFTRYESFETDLRNRYFGNVYVNYKPMSWLNLLARVTLDTYSELEQERKALTSVGVPYYRRFNQDYQEVNYDLLASGDWNFSQDINFKALLGSNTRTQNRGSIDATTNGGLVAPKLYTISNSLNAPPAPIEYEAVRRVESVFTGFTFTYKNTYTLDGTLRRDKSSTLPKGNNAYYYPSISAGFVFSQLVKQPWLSYGKFRANFAQVRNDAAPYQVKNTYVSDLDPNSGQAVTNFNGHALFSISGTYNNENLRPEKVQSYEVGLEMALFKSRFGFDFTYYNSKAIDQIARLPFSTSLGVTRKVLNTGIITNNGIELSVYGTPLKTRDFSWDINVNYTRNRNKVTQLFGDLDNIVLASFQGSITVNASLNQPYGTIQGTDYIYTGGKKTVDADGNYLISATNNITIGNVNPDWTGGINNKFTYKGIYLSALIDIKQGGDVFNTDLYYALAGGLYEETAAGGIRETLANGGGIIRDGVFEDGKPNDVRIDLHDDGSGATYGQFDSYVSAPDRRFVYDASYVKLREVTIGYSIPRKVFGNSFIKGIDVSLIGRNLAILHKNLPYADPEDSFGSGNFQGVQIGSYPGVRSMGFNVKVKF